VLYLSILLHCLLVRKAILNGQIIPTLFFIIVYCTAWTYYGSIAAESGLGYLPIYLGPILIIPTWMIILKKIIRISRVNKISSIADFISLRKQVLGSISYHSLYLEFYLHFYNLNRYQIPSYCYKNTSKFKYFTDTTTYVCLVLALFTPLLRNKICRRFRKRRGIVTVESSS
jgi:hypothetical protein